jgi:hypothetical protein
VDVLPDTGQGDLLGTIAGALGHLYHRGRLQAHGELVSGSRVAGCGLWMVDGRASVLMALQLDEHRADTDGVLGVG